MNDIYGQSVGDLADFSNRLFRDGCKKTMVDIGRVSLNQAISINVDSGK